MKKVIGYLNYVISKVGYELKEIKDILPIETNNSDLEIIQSVKSNSMSSNLRLYELIQAVKYINRNNIKGDFVECGVWRGANLVVMQKLIEQYNIENKSVYGFDTFDGMSEPTEFDLDYAGNSAKELMTNTKKDEKRGIWAYSPKEKVFDFIQNNVLNKKNINLIEGKVEDTLLNSNNLPEKISLLRLDTDFYESTKIELEILYPLLEKGGVLIIDDYGHFEGARKAVDEYFNDKELWLKYVDYTCRLYIKE